MKVWASATAIGFSMAYLACSSSPASDGNTYVPPSGTAGASAAGASSTAGSPSGTAGAPPAGGGASAGGAPPAGGGAPPAGGGAGGGAPPAGGGAGGAAGGSMTGEGPCPMINGKMVDGHCDAGATAASYPTYPGYTLSLVEDFPAAIDLDKDPILTWSDGSPESGQTGFRKENILFANGKMQLKAESMCPAKTTNSNCYDARAMVYGEAQNPNVSAAVLKMGVYSGELRTKYNNYRYGRYEAKFKAPIANPGKEATDNMSGDYLSTMFVFRTPKNVTWNEIDVELEPNHHNVVAGNVVNFTNTNPNNPVSFPFGAPSTHPWPVLNEVEMGLPAGYQISQEHTYAFTWTPTAIDWYVDNMTTPVQHFAGTAGDPIPTLSAKIMMNLWIFSGDAFGDGANNKYPMMAEYEYFRFYKLDTETKYPCSPTPACLDAADKTKSSQNNPSEMNYGM